LEAQENVMRPAASPPPALNRFVKVDALNVSALLPPPPAPDSVAGKADIESVLQVQTWRTPEQVEWAKLVDHDDVFNHANLIGAWFKTEGLPLTTDLFKKIGEDMRALDGIAKKPFLRPRPASMDERVQPCVRLPTSTSYPSGSGMQALVWAELLAEVFPAKRKDLLERAHRAGWGRVIGGVHYPSDLTAGRLLGEIYLAECRKNPVFRDAFTACRNELIAAAAKGK
jgi:acid phosphatase (class A)